MKRFLALLISVLMALSLVTIPVFAENTDNETSKVKPGSAVAVKPNDAETLDEALNVPGGTLTFVSDGDYPWEIYEDGARSTNMGVSSSESSVKTTVEATVGGEVLQFDFMSFGEGGSYDILQLFIDDERVEYWARVEEVETFGYPLTVGTHEVRWTYKKDGSVDKPGDYALIDNVQILPPQHPEEIEVFDITMYPGQETPVQVRVYPEAAFNKDVTYEIADTGVATVTPEGVVYGVASGVTTLTVTPVDNGVQGFATVTIMEFPTYDPESLNEALNIPGGTLEFVYEDDFPWIAAEDGGATSTNIGAHGTSCSVSTTVNVVGGERIEFDFLCFGEQNDSGRVWDGMHFYVDGSLIEDWGEEFEMLHFSYVLTPGTHVLTWAYEKDDDWSEPGDYAWLDNVYIGERTMPEEIIVDDVTVPAGRRTYSSYTVLPEDAYNNNATYSTADASIATVDENGVVYGVAEGTTTLIVTAVDGGAYGTATITVTEALPTVNLYGYMCFSNELQVFPNYWGTFADYDPSIVTELDSAPQSFAAASVGNNIYGFETNGKFFSIDKTEGMVLRYTGYKANDTILAMAFDYTTNTLYAIANTDNGHVLYTVDRAVGTLIEVGAFDAEALIHTLAIDADGNAYGIGYENAVLYSIDLENAHCTEIGSTGLQVAFVQSMTYDMNTDTLYWAHYYPTGDMYIVDPETAEVTCLGVIGGGAEITGLLTLCDIEVPDPVAPEFTVRFIDGIDGTVIGTVTATPGFIVEEFPEAPVHEGYEFRGWNNYYPGDALYQDTDIVAGYYNLSEPIANLIGYITAAQGDAPSGMWGAFTDYAPQQIESLGNMKAIYAAASVGTTIYGYTDWGEYFVIDTTESMEPTFLTGYANGWAVLGMAYDYTTETMFAIYIVGADYYLGTVNLETGEVTAVGLFTAPAHIYTLAVDAEGTIYGIGYEDGVLYDIDPETAECTPIGSTGLTLHYIQSMTYDMNTGKLLFANYNIYIKGALYEIDPETANATYYGAIGNGAEVVGLLTLYVPQTPPELGDVNNDGNVNMADAALIIRYSMGIIDETALDVTVADVNGSGNINIEDAVLVIRIALGLA